MVQGDGLVLALQAADWIEEGAKKKDRQNLVRWPHSASGEAGDVSLTLDAHVPG